MASLDDPGVRALWVDVQEGQLAVNSAVGRAWPSNLERNPTVTVMIYDEANPNDYHPFRTPDEQRITYLVEPSRIRHQKQR